MAKARVTRQAPEVAKKQPPLVALNLRKFPAELLERLRIEAYHKRTTLHDFCVDLLSRRPKIKGLPYDKVAAELARKPDRAARHVVTPPPVRGNQAEKPVPTTANRTSVAPTPQLAQLKKPKCPRCGSILKPWGPNMMRCAEVCRENFSLTQVETMMEKKAQEQSVSRAEAWAESRAIRAAK